MSSRRAEGDQLRVEQVIDALAWSAARDRRALQAEPVDEADEHVGDVDRRALCASIAPARLRLPHQRPARSSRQTSWSRCCSARSDGWLSARAQKLTSSVSSNARDRRGGGPGCRASRSAGDRVRVDAGIRLEPRPDLVDRPAPAPSAGCRPWSRSSGRARRSSSPDSTAISRIVVSSSRARLMTRHAASTSSCRRRS